MLCSCLHLLLTNFTLQFFFFFDSILRVIFFFLFLFMLCSRFHLLLTNITLHFFFFFFSVLRFIFFLHLIVSLFLSLLHFRLQSHSLIVIGFTQRSQLFFPQLLFFLFTQRSLFFWLWSGVLPFWGRILPFLLSLLLLLTSTQQLFLLCRLFRFPLLNFGLQRFSLLKCLLPRLI